MEMRQVPQTLDSAGDGIRFGENACANANQGSEELDHEPSKTSDHDDGANVPKKVHTFYFVKFWPHQEPSSEPDEIQEIEKLIRKMDRDQLFIRKRLEKVSFQRWEFRHGLIRLQGEDIELQNDFGWRRYELKRLEEILDKLCFANKSNQARAKESRLLLGDKIDNQFQMLHCCKSLAKEKQLMRDIKARQKKSEEDHMCSTLSLEELDWSDYWKYYKKCYAKKNIGLASCDRDHDRNGIKELKLRVDKYVYKNAVKGKIWNFFGLKQAIIDKLKIVGNDIDTLKKKQSEVRAEYGCIDKKLQTTVKVRDSLNKQLTDIDQRKKELCKLFLELREQYAKEKACCYPNRLLLSRGLALARKKDIAALERFSHTEGEKFMSQWNKSKAFRDDYKERVLHHHSTAVNN